MQKVEDNSFTDRELMLVAKLKEHLVQVKIKVGVAS